MRDMKQCGLCHKFADINSGRTLHNGLQQLGKALYPVKNGVRCSAKNSKWMLGLCEKLQCEGIIKTVKEARMCFIPELKDICLRCHIEIDDNRREYK